MLVNDIEEITKEVEILYSKPADVEYVRYDGYDRYCNLCSGVLELRINGEKWLFCGTGEYEGVYPSFFSPTVCYADGNIKEKHTAWETDVSVMPEKLRCFAKIIDDVINANMPDYICRGCD